MEEFSTCHRQGEHLDLREMKFLPLYGSMLGTLDVGLL